MATQEIDKEKLLSILNQVRPALSTQNYIPILSHFLFDGETVSAYDDINSISLKCDLGIKCCLPGDLLIKTLNSMNSSKVVFADNGDHVALSAGRSKIKIPTLPADDFPFAASDLKDPDFDFDASEALLEGIRMCLIGVGTDPTHPAQLGITIDPAYDAGTAAIYSTDNITISRYLFDAKLKFPADQQIILPTFFCNQLLSLAKSRSKEEIWIEVRAGSIVAQFGDEATLFSKMAVDLEPLDFDKIVTQYLGSGNQKFVDIPDQFDSSFERALLVTADEMDKITSVITDGKKLTMRSTSAKGESVDEMSYAGSAVDFKIDPTYVRRISGSCDKVLMMGKALAFSACDGEFVHLIAHVA